MSGTTGLAAVQLPANVVAGERRGSASRWSGEPRYRFQSPGSSPWNWLRARRSRGQKVRAVTTRKKTTTLASTTWPGSPGSDAVCAQGTQGEYRVVLNTQATPSRTYSEK